MTKIYNRNDTKNVWILLNQSNLCVTNHKKVILPFIYQVVKVTAITFD